MSYKHQLSPWCIIRHQQNLQNLIVARFRRRSDADAHLQLLKRLIPTVPFSIIFDITLESTDPLQDNPKSKIQ